MRNKIRFSSIIRLILIRFNYELREAAKAAAWAIRRQTMYITVLDYASGKVIIEEFEGIIDAEEYVSDAYGLDNCYYMTTEKLDLHVLTIKNNQYVTRSNISTRVL